MMQGIEQLLSGLAGGAPDAPVEAPKPDERDVIIRALLELMMKSPGIDEQGKEIPLEADVPIFPPPAPEPAEPQMFHKTPLQPGQDVRQRLKTMNRVT